MRISDEALEVAAKALKPSAWDERVNWGSEDSREIHQNYYKNIARTVLTASAPYLEAQALYDAVAAFPLETITAPDNAVVWMARRARELRSQP